MALRGFDLNLVPALNALLEERNVTRAAERVAIGQPAMSAALARLRRHFDDPLLVRRGRIYELSIFAESLIEPVRDAMGALNAATAVRREFNASKDIRSFTIAASDYATLVFLRPVLARLAHAAPGVCLRLVPISLDMGAALRRGTLDLVILPKELAGELAGLPSADLFEDRFVLAADPNNPALMDHEDTIDVELMKRLPFAAMSAEVQPLVDLRLAARGIELRIEVTTQSVVVAPMLVTGTPLVCLVQRRLAQLLADQAQLRFHRSPIDVGSFVEAMYWSPRLTDDPASRWLRTQLGTQARQL